MKYKIWHDGIIAKARAETRKKGGNTYYENHHIIPRSLGGSNRRDNLVLLTAREHFVIHWLLTKIYDGDARKKMKYAMWAFVRKTQRQGRNLTSRQFETARRMGVEAQIGRKFSGEHRQKLSDAHKGVTLSDEHRAAQAEGRRGKKRGSYKSSKPWSEERRSVMRTRLTGRTFSDETKRKMSEAAKNRRKQPWDQVQHTAAQLS